MDECMLVKVYHSPKKVLSWVIKIDIQKDLGWLDLINFLLKNQSKPSGDLIKFFYG